MAATLAFLLLLGTATLVQAQQNACIDVNVTAICTMTNSFLDCSARGFTLVPCTIPVNTIYMDLSSNEISYIVKGSFAQSATYSQLQFLNLSSNILPIFNGDQCEGINELQKLDLSHNIISYVGNFAAAGCVTLQHLFLNSNKLSSIDFTGLSDLSDLTVANNVLTIITSSMFPSSTSIYQINFDFNLISSFELGTWQNNNFRTLSLRGIDISNSQSLNFAELSSLYNLNLDHSNIGVIVANTFPQQLTQLASISLINSTISTISSQAFSGLQQNTFLDFAGSKITVISSSAFPSNFPSFTCGPVNDPGTCNAQACGSKCGAGNCAYLSAVSNTSEIQCCKQGHPCPDFSSKSNAGLIAGVVIGVLVIIVVIVVVVIIIKRRRQQQQQIYGAVVNGQEGGKDDDDPLVDPKL